MKSNFSKLTSLNKDAQLHASFGTSPGILFITLGYLSPNKLNEISKVIKKMLQYASGNLINLLHLTPSSGT